MLGISVIFIKQAELISIW